MPEDNPSIMSHVSIGTNDFERCCAFYDRVLAAVGARRVHEVPGHAVAYAFWDAELAANLGM